MPSRTKKFQNSCAVSHRSQSWLTGGMSTIADPTLTWTTCTRSPIEQTPVLWMRQGNHQLRSLGPHWRRCDCSELHHPDSSGSILLSGYQQMPPGIKSQNWFWFQPDIYHGLSAWRILDSDPLFRDLRHLLKQGEGYEARPECAVLWEPQTKPTVFPNLLYKQLD